MSFAPSSPFTSSIFSGSFVSGFASCACASAGLSPLWTGSSSGSSAPSSSGFSVISVRTRSTSSMRESWRSLMACCSWGVITSCCVILRCCFSSSAIASVHRLFVQPELLSEIDRARLVRRRDLRRRARLEDRPGGEDVRARADAERLAHGVVRDEDADALVAQRADEPLQLADGDRVHARERLVEEDVARAPQEAP